MFVNLIVQSSGSETNLIAGVLILIASSDKSDCETDFKSNCTKRKMITLGLTNSTIRAVQRPIGILVDTCR